MYYYTYAYLREDRTPYYIGKGKGRRVYLKHQKGISVPKDKSRIIFLKQNLTEEEAFKHEIYMIAVLGRKDLGTGILRNKTDGGEGPSGAVRSEEQRKNVSEGKKGKSQTKEHSENMGKARRGGKWWNDGLGNRKYSKECPGDVWVLGMDCPCSEERKEKMSIKRKMRVGWKHKEETKKKMMKSRCKYIYELQSPNGEVFITNNLTDFCKENPQYALNRRLMCAVAHGKQRYHKGWTVRILEHIT
jgi:hypothetical protein